MPAPSSSVRSLSRQWTGRLATYRQHRNDEHLEALVAEAARFVGFHLEDALAEDAYWSQAPLGRRVAVLLFLVDRGAVERADVEGRVVFVPTAEAESWAATLPALAPYLPAVLALLSALRDVQARRLPPGC